MYVDGEYLDKNPTWHVEDSAWKAGQIHGILLKNDVKASLVCEVGCGAGEILKQLSLRMPTTQFYGYELSPQAFTLCASRKSEKVSYLLKDIADDDVFYDVLLCIDVFEHVEDYFGFVKLLKSKSKYQVFHIPLDISVSSVLRGTLIRARESMGHLHYFTPETALATLRDCGYEIVDHSYTKFFNELPAPRAITKIANIFRRVLFFISPDLMTKLMGGCSLIVLTK
jgi:hypothetical protein